MKRGWETMKQSRIKEIYVFVSDKKGKQYLADQVASSHLRFVERSLNELGLSKEGKLIVLDGIIAILKASANS